jgi:membrane protein DedA with SNARE-associated domain
MPSWITDQPFAITVAALFVIVFFRAQGTYWLGRAARAGALHTLLARRLTGERLTRASSALARWGWPLVPVSFLTVGFQTFVNAAAGAVRMSWPRYTLAMLPGCAAWALIYATIGLAAFEAWVALSVRSGWAPWAASAAAATATAVVIRRRRARADAAEPPVVTTRR